MITGFDVSHYQSAGQVQQATAGAFVFVKSTQGTGNVDAEHDQDVAVIREAGVTVGHYHFAEDVFSAFAEAQWFLDHTDLRPGDLVALDRERMNGTWAQRVSYGVAWLIYVQKACGAIGFRYLNKSWLYALEAVAAGAEDRWPLWIATVGDQAGQPGVNGWKIHQFSTAGGIDHDVATGDLSAYAVPAPKPREQEDDDMAQKSIITEFSDPSPAIPDAWYAVTPDLLSRRWLPEAADRPALVATGQYVIQQLSPQLVAGTTLVGPVPHA